MASPNYTVDPPLNSSHFHESLAGLSSLPSPAHILRFYFESSKSLEINLILELDQKSIFLYQTHLIKSI